MAVRRTQNTLPNWSSALRFMESPLSFFRMHWDHEPRAVPRRTESADKSDALQTLRAVRRHQAVAKRLECVRLQRRFPKAGCNSLPGQVRGERACFVANFEPPQRDFLDIDTTNVSAESCVQKILQARPAGDSLTRDLP